MAAYVEMDQVTKTYQMGEVTIKATDGISFQVEKGEFVVVVGPSGAGKTTVLNILGGMDTATTGKVSVDGTRVDKLKGKKLIQYRREDIGFVFQFYNLMQNLTALENVELALQICKDPLDAKTVLEEVGLGERMYNFPAQLSGGEQQRVAIARALAKNPKLLLCDEPTGEADHWASVWDRGCMDRMVPLTRSIVQRVSPQSLVSPVAQFIVSFTGEIKVNTVPASSSSMSR